MNVHKNARLTPIGRALIVMQVECGQTPQAAPRAAGVCPRRARKWVARYRAEGLAGLADRSSRPRTLHRPTQLLVVDAIIALRRQRLPGNHIALRVGVSPANESHIIGGRCRLDVGGGQIGIAAKIEVCGSAFDLGDDELLDVGKFTQPANTWLRIEADGAGPDRVACRRGGERPGRS